MVGARRESDVIEQFRRTFLSRLLRNARLRQRELDVFARGQHRQEKEALEDESDLLETQEAASRIGQSADIPSKSRVPEVCGSTQPSMCSSVDFPHPDGPRTARCSPLLI